MNGLGIFCIGAFANEYEVDMYLLGRGRLKVGVMIASILFDLIELCLFLVDCIPSTKVKYHN